MSTIRGQNVMAGKDTRSEKALKVLANQLWWRRAFRVLFRILWLSLLVPCTGFLAHLFWGWDMDMQQWALVIGAILLYGFVWIFFVDLKPFGLAHKLDQRFQLQEQITTAVEVSQFSRPLNPIEQRLLDSVEGKLRDLSRHPAVRFCLPRREIETLGAIIFLGMGLMVFSTINSQFLPHAPIPLPSLGVEPGKSPSSDAQLDPRPGQPLQPAPALGQQPSANETPKSSQLSPAAQRALARLAEALRDQGITRSAANALDHGDTAAAARDLRSLADQAKNLSPQSLENLAEALQNASGDISRDAPALGRQANQTGQALRKGAEKAAQGLQDLARETERLSQNGQQQNDQAQRGQTPGSDQKQGAGNQNQPGQQSEPSSPDKGNTTGQNGGSGSGAGDQHVEGLQRTQSPEERLGIEGVPLTLSGDQPGTDKRTTQPAQNPISPVAGGSTSGAGFERAGSSSNETIQSGVDPLRYPWELRHVVQEYFTPK
ncbi:MAG: hypothetical protein HY326_08820 [Chloroflexi bacterium]|nr:hypothetical protein [Chloroflexota bacterium]